MAFGWLSVAIAFVLVDSQTRSLRGYTDELSGLFGRKYMNYCLDRIHATQGEGRLRHHDGRELLQGNQRHPTGTPRATVPFREIGHILSGALVANSVAIRMSGDEFMVLIRHGSEELLDEICTAIEQRVQHYNATAPAGSFQPSFSTGVAKYGAAAWRSFWWSWISGCTRKSAFSAARDACRTGAGKCSINLKIFKNN